MKQHIKKQDSAWVEEEQEGKLIEKKGREEDLTFWLFARNPLSSQVTMGQTQGRQLGKQDSAHLEHSETPGLSVSPT